MSSLHHFVLGKKTTCTVLTELKSVYLTIKVYFWTVRHTILVSIISFKERERERDYLTLQKIR
jgi:hypothetical protein